MALNTILLVLWLLSRTVGLPMNGHGRERFGVLDGLAACAELLAVVATRHELARGSSSHSSEPRR